MKTCSSFWVLALTALAFALPPALAHATEYEGDPASISVDRQGKDLRRHAEYTTHLTTPVYRIDTHYEWVKVRVTYQVCNGSAVDPECHTEYKWENVYKQVRTRNFDHSANREFKIVIENSVLLPMEYEQFTVHFDGIRDSLDTSSEFNQYNVERRDGREMTAFYLTATRLQARPVNSVEIQPSNRNGEFVLEARDLGYDPEIGGAMGEATVTVEIYQKVPLWFDKKIGALETKLPTRTDSTTIRTGVQPQHGKFAYAKFAIRRVGSQYHNDKSSEKKKSAEIRF